VRNFVAYLFTCSVAGCGFSGQDPADGRATPLSDAKAADIDASSDDCLVTFSPTPPSVTNRVGGEGGGDRPDLSCPADQIPVGFRFKISDQQTAHGSISTTAIELHCARLAISKNDERTYSDHTVFERAGAGGSGWTPATYQPVTPVPPPIPAGCGPKSMLVGLAAAGGSQPKKVFANVALNCRAMPTLNQFGPDTALKIPNTGGATSAPYNATCPPDQILQFLKVKAGLGIDSVTPYCNRIQCQ
jgi:hypothetical protein